MESISCRLRVLLATVRDNGLYPCPRCLVPKDKIHKLGLPEDTTFRTDYQRQDDRSRHQKIQQARDHLHRHGKTVTSKVVEDLLKPESLVPTQVWHFPMKHLAILRFLCLECILYTSL